MSHTANCESRRARSSHDPRRAPKKLDLGGWKGRCEDNLAELGYTEQAEKMGKPDLFLSPVRWRRESGQSGGGHGFATGSVHNHAGGSAVGASFEGDL